MLSWWVVVVFMIGSLMKAICRGQMVANELVCLLSELKHMVDFVSFCLEYQDQNALSGTFWTFVRLSTN